MELPGGSGVEKSERALSDKWKVMKTAYMQKKMSLRATGSGGGPMEGYLAKMHKYLQEDLQFNPVISYSSDADVVIRREPRAVEEESGFSANELIDLSSDNEALPALPPKKKAKRSGRSLAALDREESREGRREKTNDALERLVL